MNIQDLITFVLILIITFFAIKFFVKQFRTATTLTEKTLYILLILIYFIPIIIYYLDKWNIPTLLKLTEGMDNERWFEFTSGYISTIFATIVSNVILVLITIKQIQIQVESNNKDKRIQNAPILDYIIQNIKVQTDKQYFGLTKNVKDTNNYSLYVNIENIGLNHAKNIHFKIQDNDSKSEQSYKLDNTQSILKKDSNEWIELVFSYKYDEKNQKNNNKKIELIFYYEDLLKNKYSQDVTIYCEVTNKCSSAYGGYQLYIVSREIENEKFIELVKDVNE